MYINITPLKHTLTYYLRRHIFTRLHTNMLDLLSKVTYTKLSQTVDENDKSEQEAQLSARDRTMLCLIEYFAKSLKIRVRVHTRSLEIKPFGRLPTTWHFRVTTALSQIHCHSDSISQFSWMASVRQQFLLRAATNDSNLVSAVPHMLQQPPGTLLPSLQQLINTDSFKWQLKTVLFD